MTQTFTSETASLLFVCRRSQISLAVSMLAKLERALLPVWTLKTRPGKEHIKQYRSKIYTRSTIVWNFGPVFWHYSFGILQVLLSVSLWNKRAFRFGKSVLSLLHCEGQTVFGIWGRFRCYQISFFLRGQTNRWNDDLSTTWRRKNDILITNKADSEQ